MVAGAKDPLDVARLCASLRALPVSFLPTAAELLSTFEDDPRIASTIAELVLDPPTTSSSTYPFWTRSLAVLARSRDARAVSALTKRLAMPKGGSTFWPKFYDALAKTRARLEGETPSAAAGRELLARAASLTTKSSQETRAAAAEETAAPLPEFATRLELATHLLSTGQLARAIDVMVEVWRAARAPELANRIDRASRLLPDFDVPIALGVKRSLEAWMALYEEGKARSMPRLLDNLNVGGASFAEQRLARLASLDDDPRVALRLAELTASHAVSPERTQYWKTLLEIVARARDVRTAGPLRSHFRDFTGNYYNHHRQARRILGDFALVPGEAPVLPKSEAAIMPQLDAALRNAEATGDTERKLIGALVADFDDPAPRAVYADWLSSRGHPRGELITLETKGGALSPAEKKRHGELLEVPCLFGPFDDLAGVGNFGQRASAGFVRDLHVSTWASTLTWRRVAAYPLLAIVRSLEFNNTVLLEPTPEDLAATLRAAVSLREVRRAPPALVTAVLPLLDEAFEGQKDTLTRRR